MGKQIISLVQEFPFYSHLNGAEDLKLLHECLPTININLFITLNVGDCSLLTRPKELDGINLAHGTRTK